MSTFYSNSEKYPRVEKYIGKARWKIAELYLAANKENNEQDMRLILQHVGNHAYVRGKKKWVRLYNAIENGNLSWIRGIAGQNKEKRDESEQNQKSRNERHSQREQYNQNEQKTTRTSPKTPIERAFNIFGLEPEASPDEIKKRYRELVKMFHPDTNKDNPHKEKFENNLKEVNLAHGVLKQAGLC